MTIYETTLKGKKITALVISEDTRSGFRHRVEIQQNGWIMASAKTNYYNRTWERYHGESTINAAIDGAKWSQDKEENAKIKKQLKRQFARRALPKWAW